MCVKKFTLKNEHSPSSQRTPLRPGGQMQLNLPIPSTHVLPNPQGLEAHSLMLILQSGPVNPGAHSHRNQLIPSTHFPPLKQGGGLQSFISCWQCWPSKPSLQIHE